MRRNVGLVGVNPQGSLRGFTQGALPRRDEGVDALSEFGDVDFAGNIGFKYRLTFRVRHDFLDTIVGVGGRDMLSAAFFFVGGNPRR